MSTINKNSIFEDNNQQEESYDEPRLISANGCKYKPLNTELNKK